MGTFDRTLGLLRSLAIYHGVPWRARQLRRFYAAYVPAGALGSTAQLGWTSWMGASKPRRGDARDALFEPREVV